LRYQLFAVATFDRSLPWPSPAGPKAPRALVTSVRVSWARGLVQLECSAGCD